MPGLSFVRGGAVDGVPHPGRDRPEQGQGHDEDGAVQALGAPGLAVLHAEAARPRAAERLDKEVKRRADVVGIFPGEASITRLIGAVLLEQNDEWQTDRRYMQLEGMAELTPPAAEAEPAQIPPRAA